MAAHTTALPTVKARHVQITRASLKIAAAVALLIAGAYGLFCERGYVVSSEAVVSTYLLEIRTPIDGVLTGLPLQAGLSVHQGDVLGHVANLRVDHQHLYSLRAEAESADTTAEALADERTSLEAQRGALLVRAGQHSLAVASRLRLQTDEASRVLAARQLALNQANIELARGHSLHDAGILATAEFDRLVSSQLIATEQVRAQEAEVASLRGESESAARGMFSGPGLATDVVYSRQRADEIALRMTESARASATARVQARQAHLSLASETQHTSLLERADLLSPIDGVLWNLDSVSGERATTGDAVLSLVDCSRQFLLVPVAQDRVPEIAIHQRASFRLTGESIERSGMVLSVSGNSENRARKFASVPTHRIDEDVATVVIGLDTSIMPTDGDSHGCNVGRTAHVLVPTEAHNAFSRWVHHYF